MDRETITKTIEMLGYTPTIRPVNARVYRVWALSGRNSRSLGYLSTIQQMTEDRFIQHVKDTFARKAR